jgi:hypothetical protein
MKKIVVNVPNKKLSPFFAFLNKHHLKCEVVDKDDVKDSIQDTISEVVQRALIKSLEKPEMKKIIFELTGVKIE